MEWSRGNWARTPSQVLRSEVTAAAAACVFSDPQPVRAAGRVNAVPMETPEERRNNRLSMMMGVNVFKGDICTEFTENIHSNKGDRLL
ncbi:MAG: hypothetical protein RIA62_14530 [Cyclobacteriaceae bacterium]